MSTVVSNIQGSEYNYPKRLFVKGASEMVLETCSHYLDANGVQKVKDKAAEEMIINQIINYASNAL